MMTADRRAPVHEIIGALRGALTELGSNASVAEMEAWGFSIHAALSGGRRHFHNHAHIMEVMADLSGLDVLAALYHDVVYVQVDRGWPRTLRDQLSPVLAAEPGPMANAGADALGPTQGWRVLPAPAGSAVADVLAVFGRTTGEVITPGMGLNELASALVAAVHLQHALDRRQLIALVACIEQTIPFREDPAGELHQRLGQLGLQGGQREQVLERAVRFGNSDVANFASERPQRFLENTWKLLAESNPAFQSPLVYTVAEYRLALRRMESFLAGLVPEHIFHRWGSEPEAELHSLRLRRAADNLDLGLRYMRAKLYSIGIAEALAHLTGGDVPLDYFMGGVDSSSGSAPRRIEQFLPALPSASAVDPRLQDLLTEGRADESTFDTGPSPLGAFLHAAVGEAGVMRGFEAARRWWDGDQDAASFLAGQPPAPVAGIARAAASIMESRRDRLLALAQRIDRAHV